MIKIGSCTVLYNPDIHVINNLETYVRNVDISVIVDNSDDKNVVVQNLKNDKRFIYIDMNGNKGIAAALNRGIEYLYNQGIEFALTMDQDSQFPSQFYQNIVRIVDRNKQTYSVIGLNFNHKVDTSNANVIEAHYWLTSGNFVNIADFINVGKFNENLFIDYVDIEYGYKLYRHNLRLCYLEGYSLRHKIGNPIEIHLFNKKFYAMNHSPIRYYYRYRNSFYLYKMDKKFFRREYWRELFINIPKMIFFEHDRKNKFKMICKGIRDAKKGKLGVYNG